MILFRCCAFDEMLFCVRDRNAYLGCMKIIATDKWISNADVSTSPSIIGGLGMTRIATTEGSSYSPGERKAHARLIAAAPDLLAVCVALTKPMTGNKRTQLAALRGAARTAIAKSDGMRA